MSKELEVRNLSLSFYTNRGMVRAIRDISFTLNKGETIAIVGESGSGKSVTAKAILGIEAPNAVIENGEILYKGEDVLKYSEEDFNKIRGNEITMIYQDPLSSLDPIMKIGKQMTEATLLNDKTTRKNARNQFNSKIKELRIAMIAAGIDKRQVATKLDEFKKFIDIGNALKHRRDTAREFADSVVFDIEQLQNDFISDTPRSLKDALKHLCLKLNKVYDTYVVPSDDKKVPEFQAKLEALVKIFQNGDDTLEIQKVLMELSPVLKTFIEKDGPNFFCLGYYLLKNEDVDITKQTIPELNKIIRAYIDDNFMNEFIANIKQAMKADYERYLPAKKQVIKSIKSFRTELEKNNWNISKCVEKAKKLVEQTEKSVAALSLKKHIAVYTLGNVFKAEIKKARLETVIELTEAHKTLSGTLSELENLYTELVSEKYSLDYSTLSVEMIDYFKKLSYDMVNHVTYEMAYTKAIRIMEEVGIKEPRKRFNQYSFEFSGGMRQRIVIAIAIAANPDLLICDEPTTALDVTIQAQIIELINKLKVERNMSVIFITHDLGVVANVADRVAVMYAGKIVEVGTANDIFYHPAHPYTWALLSSMPDLDTKEKLEADLGTPPNMIYNTVGDAFAERNKYAMQIDYEKQPPMFKISETHSASTWLLHPDAPKTEPPKAVTDRIARMIEKMKERGEEIDGK